MPPAQVDIRGISFDGFVDFIFDRPPKKPPREGGRFKWYHGLDILFEPGEIVTHHIQLYSRPRFLLDRFDKVDLENGFWALQSTSLSISALEVLHSRYTAFPHRDEVVRSMFHLFEGLFSVEPLKGAPFMWWDNLASWFSDDQWHPARSPEDKLMQNVMFETLSSILSLDSRFCQVCALHGLGHLRHPETRELINDYLRRNPMLDDDMKLYAHHAAAFGVM